MSTSPPSAENPAALKERIRAEAYAVGFDAVGFAPARLPAEHGENLKTYVMEGRHHHRISPDGLWPEAQSVIVLGTNYGPHTDPTAIHQRTERAAISVYAQGRDYHDVVKKRLKTLGRWMVETLDCSIKVFVDTAPVMEKPLAQLAGLGWQGKHTNVVSRDFGSWLFLGEVFTTLDLPPDAPHVDQCGTCTACLEACPTGAITPYQMDAGKCISYLTIEHKGAIAPDLMAQMGNRVYGCDDCLAACPWTKFTQPHREPHFFPRIETAAPRLSALAELDDADFRQVFSASPVKRTQRDAMMRNTLIALGNTKNSRFQAPVKALADDDDATVRATAKWALNQFKSP